jgi:hypothetical protein
MLLVALIIIFYLVFPLRCRQADIRNSKCEMSPRGYSGALEETEF